MGEEDSLIRIKNGQDKGWYFVSPTGDRLVHRPIPKPEMEWAEREFCTENSAKKQYSLEEIEELTGLSLNELDLSQPECWTLVVRKLEELPSWNLHDEINKQLNALHDFRSTWGEVKRLCHSQIEELGNFWRVNDDDGQGVLLGGAKSLLTLEDRLPQAMVDQTKLNKEEGLSYALFNVRKTRIDNYYQIISREAPLLRPKSRASRVLYVKCDLVAYHTKENMLVAIEVKLRPDNKSTQIRHGFLQAMAYGYILKQCLSHDSSRLQQQVKNCMSRWCGQDDKEWPIEKIAYGLAAPKSYFSESLREKDGKAKDWLRDATKIKTDGLLFDGFWVLPENDKIKTDGEVGTSKCIPKLPETDCVIKRIADIDKLVEYCN